MSAAFEGALVQLEAALDTARHVAPPALVVELEAVRLAVEALERRTCGVCADCDVPMTPEGRHTTDEAEQLCETAVRFAQALRAIASGAYDARGCADIARAALGVVARRAG